MSTYELIAQIDGTLSIEWILGGVFSIMVFLIGYIFIATLKDLKDSIKLINDSLKHMDKENRERDKNYTMMEYRFKHLEDAKVDSDALANKIVGKIRAITPQ